MTYDQFPVDDEPNYYSPQSPTPHYSSTSHPYKSYSTTPMQPMTWSRDTQGDAYRALKKRRKQIIGIVTSVICVLLLSCGVAFGLYIDHVNKALNQGNKTEEQVQAIQDELKEHVDFTEPFYMLLLGSDEREGEGGGARSDTNIVAYVDSENSLVTLISIPRDTRIEIQGHGHQKFNAAYAYGDTAGAIRAANELLDIEISHYAEVSFSELTELVDAVGGVDITVESRINDRNADLVGAEHTIIEEGEQHLNGTEALVYARSRSFADGDFTRTTHQRELISALLHKILSKPVTELPGIIEKAANCVTTDFTLNRLIDLANQFKDTDDLTIYSAMVPSYTAEIGGVSYVINDEEATERMMELVEKGKDPSVISPSANSKAIAAYGSDGSSASPSSGNSSPSHIYAPPTVTQPEDPEVPGEGEGGEGEPNGGGENPEGPSTIPGPGSEGGEPNGGGGEVSPPPETPPSVGTDTQLSMSPTP